MVIVVLFCFKIAAGPCLQIAWVHVTLGNLSLFFHLHSHRFCTLRHVMQISHLYTQATTRYHPLQGRLTGTGQFHAALGNQAVLGDSWEERAGGAWHIPVTQSEMCALCVPKWELLVDALVAAWAGISCVVTNHKRHFSWSGMWGYLAFSKPLISLQDWSMMGIPERVPRNQCWFYIMRYHICSRVLGKTSILEKFKSGFYFLNVYICVWKQRLPQGHRPYFGGL